MAKKRQERRANRQKRREFAAVAIEAAEQAYDRGEIDNDKMTDLSLALRRPRGVETIRSAFANEVGPEQLKLGEVAGKIDFDRLFDLLTGFFPKLANLRKFFGIFQRIRQIAKEPA